MRRDLFAALLTRYAGSSVVEVRDIAGDMLGVLWQRTEISHSDMLGVLWQRIEISQGEMLPEFCCRGERYRRAIC